MKNTIRIGLFLEQQQVPAWIKQIIDAVQQLDFVDIQLIGFNGLPQENVNNKAFFHRLHERIEHLLFGKRLAYSQIADISEFICSFDKTAIISNLQSNLEQVSLYNLDVILNLSSLSIKYTGFTMARFGVWTCMVDHQNVVKESSNIYWSVVEQAPVFNVDVFCSNDTSGHKTIRHASHLATNFNSLLLNLESALDLYTVLIPRLLTKIYANYSHPIAYQDFLLKNYPIINGVTARLAPTNWEAIKNMVRIASRYLYKRLFFKQTARWFLMYKFNPSPMPDAIHEYVPLIPEHDRFWADPFVLSEKERNYVFIEEYPYKKRKGHIAYLEFDREGKVIHRETVLERPYHMSYPFVFEDSSEKYMIPETSQNNTIELYRCTDFPSKWTFVMNLMENVKAKDTTLLFYNNKWWMFTAIKETNSFSDYLELYLFYSDAFNTTNWLSHPQNPISSDIRYSRPAGKIFFHNDKLYRPSQDCSIRYGRALNISQIIKLSETEYEEVLVSKFEADWHSKLKGVHTVNHDNNLSVLDAYSF